MTTETSIVKIFKVRDSATSLLRKLGIQPKDYGIFIEKMADGRFACQVTKAAMHLESLKNPAPKAKGVSNMTRELIRAGRTNQEVWAVIKETFNLDDSKKHYPTWYRCEMKRKGQLPVNV